MECGEEMTRRVVKSLTLTPRTWQWRSLTNLALIFGIVIFMPHVIMLLSSTRSSAQVQIIETTDLNSKTYQIAVILSRKFFLLIDPGMKFLRSICFSCTIPIIKSRYVDYQATMYTYWTRSMCNCYLLLGNLLYLLLPTNQTCTFLHLLEMLRQW